MAVAHLEVLQQRIAQRLRQATLDLPLDLLPIDGLPHIMHTDDREDAYLSGERVHLYLDGLRRVAIAIVRTACASLRVESSGGGWVKLIGGDRRRRFALAPLVARRDAGVAHGLASDQG